MIELFKYLTEEELNRLEKFIFSPYHTTQKNLVRLFKYLRPLHPKITDEDISKQKISVYVYSQKRVNDNKIRKLLSDFAILMERFFTQLESEKINKAGKIALLSFLRRKGLRKRFEMKYRELLNENKKSFSKDEDFYFDQFKMDNEYYYHSFTNLREENASYLIGKSDNLDFLYAFAKLHTFNEMHNMEESQNKKIFKEKIFLNEILEFVRSNIKIIEKEHPNLFIIYNVFMMFYLYDDKYFDILLNYLKANEKNFSIEKLRYYYNYLTTYYIRKINQGEERYKKEVVKIYKLMREKNLFLIDNIITDQEFNNVSNMALSVKEFGWLNEFVEEYRNHIDKKFAEDSYNLVKAKLAFHTKDFVKAFEHLQKIGLSDPNYYTNAKYLLARLHFETGNFEGVRYIIENLRQYLRGSKSMTPEQKSGIDMFKKFLPDLLRLYESQNKKEKQGLKLILKKQLDAENKFVPNKFWFYDKLEEIS